MASLLPPSLSPTGPSRGLRCTLGWGSTWDPGPLSLWRRPHTVSRHTPAGSPRAVHQHACAELATRASAGPACAPGGQPGGAAPLRSWPAAPHAGAPRADTRRQRWDSATAGIPGTRTTIGILKTWVKDVLPAMQPLDSTVWWLMPARSPGRGDQTDRRAQRSTVWGPRPWAARSAAAARSAPTTAPGRLGSRVAPGPQAARGCGPRVQTLGSAHPEAANLAARPGTVDGVREEVSARLKDCLVPRRQTRWAGEPLPCLPAPSSTGWEGSGRWKGGLFSP